MDLSGSSQSGLLADLVAYIGETGFAGRIMRTFHGLCAADMCSGFAIFDNTLQSLFAESIDPGRSAFARTATLRYVQKYWKRDTATASTLGRAHRNVQIIRRPSSVIRDLDYRHECYSEGEVVERISICKAGSVPIVANAYRGRTSGAFAQAQIECFEAAAPIVVAAIEKHVRLTYASRSASLADHPAAIAKQLHGMENIGLSRREAQVLAFIFSGIDQNTIARELGIGVSTIVTYRRRGYEKLCVRNRSELRKCLIDRGRWIALGAHSSRS